MKERPIIFGGDGVLSILEGRKTQTRRVVKFPATPKWMQIIEHQAMKVAYPMPMGGWVFWDADMGQEFSDKVYQNDPDGIRCPYGQPGDRLWCKETWGLYDTEPKDGPVGAMIFHKATDGENYELRHQLWRSPIFMPRWASRITLEITGVRVERLQDITPIDCEAEGIFLPLLENPTVDEALHYLAAYNHAYEKLWDSINAKRGYGWETNCWVWVIGFKKLETAPRTDVLNY